MRIKKETIFFILILIAGVFVRLYNFGIMPDGLNQDEAFAGYEAYSMLKYGIDSWGYHNPVYFVSWGSGMNVLSSYLMMPFIAVFGNCAFAVRMPQLIASVFALWVFYLILKECMGVRTALIGMFVLAISPWHVMVSRWALESNMAPHMWLFGFYFFMKGMKDNRFLPISMFFYGLSLYAYATMWFFVPITLLLMFCYAFSKKYIKNIKMFITSGFVLGILALPHILFVLVNKSVIPEIKTSFISIPKLLYMRSGEISISNMFDLETYKNLFNILIKQNDGQVFNSIKYGSYYHLSIPFAIIGIFRAIKEKGLFSKMVLFNLFVAILIAISMSSTNMNRINFIHFPMLILIVKGIDVVVKSGKKGIVFGMFSAYFVLFCAFSFHYFTGYQREIARHFDTGLQKAICSLSDGNVKVDSMIFYPKILFFGEEDTKEYIDSVKFSNYPSAYLSVESFGRYEFVNDFENLTADTYIVKKDKRAYFKKHEYKAEYYDEIIIFRKLGTF